MAATTYSYKSITGAFSDPDAGVFPFIGQEGVKHMAVDNAQTRAVHDVASDGAVMVSYVSGVNGKISIECQQNSSFHQFLLNWANIKFTAAENANAANFAAAAVRIQDLLSGASHVCTGVSPSKIPDKTYGTTGATVTWELLAANIVNT